MKMLKRDNNSSKCRQFIANLGTILIFSSGLVLTVSLGSSSSRRQLLPPLLERYACFNRILEITCASAGGVNDASASSGPGVSSGDEILVFESARYGRNDTTGASRCQVPFARTCDLDVQHPLSRACGGRRRCSLAVNTAFFGDPCGYDEFLKVTYRCVPAEAVNSQCIETSMSSALDAVALDAGLARRPAAAPFVDPRRRDPLQPTIDGGGYGYVSSPNYPGKYFTDADCRWTLTVQPTQTLRLTLLDFELDVRRGGQCHDSLRIAYRKARTSSHSVTGSLTVPNRLSSSSPSTSSSSFPYFPSFSSPPPVPTSTVSASTASNDVVEVFSECGSLGKQVIDVTSYNVDVRFKTGQSGLTQRGFLMYFEAVGPGCPALADQYDERYQMVSYSISNGVLIAETVCQPRYAFYDTPIGSDIWLQRRRQIYCTGLTWNNTLPRCISVASVQSTISTSPAMDLSTRSFSALLTISEQPATLLGLVFGAVTVILLATVFVLLAIYCSRRHYTSMRPRKQWRVVLDNTHDDIQAINSRNDDVTKYAAAAVALGSTTFTEVIDDDDDDDGDCDECYKDATYRSMVKRNAPLTFRGMESGRAHRHHLSPNDDPTSCRGADRWQTTTLLGWNATSSGDCENGDERDDEELENIDVRNKQSPKSTRKMLSPRHLSPVSQTSPHNTDCRPSGGPSGCQYCEMVTVVAKTSSLSDAGESIEMCHRSRPAAAAAPTGKASRTCPDVVLTGLTAVAVPMKASPDVSNRLRTVTFPHSIAATPTPMMVTCSVVGLRLDQPTDDVLRAISQKNTSHPKCVVSMRRGLIGVRTLHDVVVSVRSFRSDWIRHSASRVSYGVMMEFTGNQGYECQIRCFTNSECDSVNYHLTDYRCQLITQYNPWAVNSTDLVSDDSWEWWAPQSTIVV